LLQEFENSALYVNDKWRETRGVWITPSADMLPLRKKLNRRYAFFTGIFDANQLGHLAQFKGTLTVKKFVVLQGDSKPLTGGK
jgi:hypothetical protein